MVTRLSAGGVSRGVRQPTLAADETTDAARDRVGPRAGNPNHRCCRRVKLDPRFQRRPADSEDYGDSADEHPSQERCDHQPKHAWRFELG